MISLDNLRTVLNAIKRTLDSTKQDKLIAGKNINIAEDGKTISATQVIEVALTEQADGSYTADITFAQLKAEVESGKQLMLIKDESRVFVLNKANDNAIEFLGADSLGVTYAKITAKANEVWEVESALTPNTDNISKISSNIGVLANLTTDDKTHLVAAINEVNNNTDLALLRIDHDRSTKQDKLIAGENITIAADGKTISATGGGGTTVELDTTLSTAGKAADAKATGDALAGKVDKVTGKGLSTNDYTNAAKAKVDAIPADPKYTDTVYDDTGVRNNMALMHDALVADSSRISTVEDKLNGSGSVTFSNVTTTNLATNNLTTKGEVEIYSDQPYIDFHYNNNSTEDYTSRIIESASGKVDVLAANGLFVNGSKVQTKSDLQSIRLDLEVYNNNLKDFSYTIKYVPVIPAVFVRFYGVFTKDLTNQTGGVKIIKFPNTFLDNYKHSYLDLRNNYPYY